MKRLIEGLHNLPVLTAALLLLAGLCVWFFAPAWCGDRLSNRNAERELQARKIIEDGKRFKELANTYIAQASQTLEETKTLKGDATMYQRNLGAIHPPVLKGKDLQAARKQFQVDLSQFARHVQQYKEHTDDVRREYGLCQNTLKAYDELKKQFSLHNEQFHLPDVPPPHICLEVGATAGEAASAANTVRNMNRRTVAEEQALMNQEKELQRQLAMSGKIDSAVMTQSALALKEQDLAAEFARLREEHRQLDVARQALSSSGVKVGVPEVKGTIKH